MIKNYSFAVILSCMFCSVFTIAAEEVLIEKYDKETKLSVPVVTNFVELSKATHKKQGQKRKNLPEFLLIDYNKLKMLE